MEILTQTTIDVEYSNEEITPHLRWSTNGTLEQAWNITHFRGGVPHKRTTEWRGVPSESPRF